MRCFFLAAEFDTVATFFYAQCNQPEGVTRQWTNEREARQAIWLTCLTVR